ncbi:hypothetical protein GGR25_003656 [Kaistia hirudinis]|uniref:DUF2971 domain-containing protein n=1 Tax=Kaistia hirudinis TaxID=1293440 RepID=A0A840ATR8_9HYPH|nr:DUF2971 domain-containing protein [Kaistia hirudinis]MBB3932598.1 hypothetical protein [Kaistia hirudinis]
MDDKTKDPKELFHYTSIRGLLGIVESNNIHASHIEFMNDRKELIYADEIIRPMMSQEFERRFVELQNASLMTNNFEMKDLCDKETSNLLSSIRLVSNRLSPLFVTSFCRAETQHSAEHGLLSQWRSYGDGGVAIVFDTKKLKKMWRRQGQNYKTSGSMFGDVVYGTTDSQYSEIASSLDMFRKAVPTMIETMIESLSGKKVSFEGDKTSIDNLFMPYVTVKPVLKHPSFHEEREFRMVFGIPRNGFSTKKLPDKKIQFKVRDNYLLPYIAIDPFDGKQLPIARVIVGPSSEPDRRKASIEMLLSEKGYSVPVSLSEIPLS